jgi:hypothetical protein
MYNKHYFILNNKKIPLICGGSADSLGSTIEVTFDTSVAYSVNTSKSSDIHFVHLALGEGPIYRINPNGPQDIEIDGKFIDDLVNFSTNNAKQEVFSYTYNTGTVSQTPLVNFFPDIVNQVRFPSPITLKSGISTSEVSATPETSVQFFQTSSFSSIAPINSIRLKFNITDLQFSDTNGSFPAQLSLAGLVHTADEALNINNYITGKGLLINSLITDSMIVESELVIPENFKSDLGYRVSALKLSPDVAEEGYTGEVEFLGFDELSKESYSYPRTATVGYAVKSSDFREGNIPNYTTLIKGLIVDVPSNYNQPILESGEVDWRQIEVAPSGDFSASTNGYRLQDSGKTLIYDSNINIYKGIWDGTYKKDWTENYAWIIKYLLTDPVNGLGLPEQAINKYSFYKAAQYYDAVNPSTGNFIGVKGFSDGTYRYKPNNFASSIPNALLGIPAGFEILERRFVCGATISDKTELLDIINSLASACRSIVTTFGNKIGLVVDQEEILPSAYFNEANIEANSFRLSGISDSEKITGVDVSYIDLANHFEKATLSLETSATSTIDIDNKLSIDAFGCTRKSQAIRLASYHLESRKNLRRKLQFKTFADASDLEVGEVIAISQRTVGTNYGFGGKIAENSNSGTSNAYLEHFTSPAITDDVFSANTNPLVLKVFRIEDNKLDYYLLNNSFYDLVATGNSTSGVDFLDLNISEKLNPVTKQFESNSQFSSKTAPKRGDLWALGEIDLNNIYGTNSGKLFKVDSLSIESDGSSSISAVEYDSNALSVSDNAASYYSESRGSSLRYVSPPPPILNLSFTPSKTPEGVVNYNILFNSTTNTENYNVPITTSIDYSIVPNIIEVFSQE